MAPKHSFDAIITDPDLDTRMRLKQASASVHQFGKVFQASSLRDAQSRLASGETIDVCFLSYRFDQMEVTQFIKDAKGTKGGQDTAYILVLKSKDQQSSTVATNVIAGFDGFLFEPYSVDQLVELTALAARVRKERAGEREAAALRFLLNDIMNQVDQIAYLKAAGFDMGPSMKKFKEMCSVLQTLEPESKIIYYNLAIDLFEQAPLPKKIFQRKIYGGASSRVKKRQEKAILEQIGIEAAEQNKT
jgi:DNA-binding NarL/FixJ family response regulator